MLSFGGTLAKLLFQFPPDPFVRLTKNLRKEEPGNGMNEAKQSGSDE
jgi:hypothetical protein